MDAPMGSCVILTADQFLLAVSKKEELNHKYYEKVHRLMEGNERVQVIKKLINFF